MILQAYAEFLANQGISTLECGIDEVGRGPLAGPVTAACVVIGPDFPLEVLGDSKALTPKKRELAYKIIWEKALAIGVGWCWPKEIDEINILQASLKAMGHAYDLMKYPCQKAWIDGNKLPKLPIPAQWVVKGDSKIPSISAASIIAKVIRDRWMERWSWIDPRYGFEIHKGYPTKAHREALHLYGPSEIHRLSFQSKSLSE